MAFFTYSAVTRELLEISDFELPTPEDGSCTEIANVTKSTLETRYVWNPTECSFLPKTGAKFLTKKDFIKKFTPAEYSAIRTAAAANGQIDYYWQLFLVAEEINLGDPDTIVGVQTLEALGLLTPGRAAEITA